jgi:hypothetical protein
MRRSVRTAVVLLGILASSCTKFQTAIAIDGGDAATTGAGGMGGGAGGIRGGSGGTGGAVVDSGGTDAAADASGGSDATVDVGPVCGNAVKEGAEQCDDGTALNTGGYGKCNANCTLGPHCGDGSINGPDEACDDGPNNGLGLNQCNPVCSGTVKEKYIKVLPTPINQGGDLTGDWDAFCATFVGNTFKALQVGGGILIGMERTASKTPFLGDGQVDWVLKPYTRYLNVAGDLVWTTDGVSLLGVRNGNAAPLINPLVPGAVASDTVWAGFTDNWTTSSFTCTNWSQTSGQGTTLSLSSQVIRTAVIDCTNSLRLLCIEQ